MPVFEHVNLFFPRLSDLQDPKESKPFLASGLSVCWVGFEAPHFRHECAVLIWIHGHCFPGSEAKLRHFSFPRDEL